MRYALDTEFIDTPTCSALISLAIVAEKGDSQYFEFEYPASEVTPWLADQVICRLGPADGRVTFSHAAQELVDFVGMEPEFWCYYGAYDWYWLCRLFGGLMNLPGDWPERYREFADISRHVPEVCGAAHHALNDAQALMAALKAARA